MRSRRCSALIFPASDDDSEATKKLESFEIQDGDRIRVFPIAPSITKTRSIWRAMSFGRADIRTTPACASPI